MAAGDWSIVDTGGTERILSSYFYFYVEDVEGADFIPFELFGTPYAVLPGETADGHRIQARDIFLKGRIVGTSFAVLRQRIAALYDVLKPWRAGQTDDNTDNLLLRYTGTQRTVEIQVRLVQIIGGARYRDGFSQALTLQFRAQEYPYWRATSNTTLALDPEDSGTSRYAIAKVSGVWDLLGPPVAPATGSVYCALHDGSNTLYIGGDFRQFNNDEDLDCFCKYTAAGGWQKCGAGGEGHGLAGVYAMVKSPSGLIYLGGAFENWGGVDAADYCISYNPSTGAYSALSTGPSGTVYDLAIDPDTGYLYAATGTTVKYWGGSAWTDLSAGFTSGSVRSICFTPDGTLYAGGQVLSGGNLYAYLRKYTGSWTTIAQSTTAGDAIYAVRSLSDGRVVVGGSFAGLSGVTLDNLGVYNGQTFSALGKALASATFQVNRLFVDSEDSVYVTYSVTGVGATSKLARWNGYQFVDVDCLLTPLGTGTVRTVAFNGSDLYLAGIWDSVVYYSGDTTTSSGGTYVSVYPQITIAASGGRGTLYFIENATLGLRCYFDALKIMDGETLTIDFSAKTITSSYGRQIRGQPIPGSDFGNFVIRGASNVINLWCRAASGATVTANLIYRMAYDGFAGGDIT